MRAASPAPVPRIWTIDRMRYPYIDRRIRSRRTVAVKRGTIAAWFALAVAVSVSTGAARGNELTSVSQTVRWLRIGEGSRAAGGATYWISYTSVGFRTDPWSLRTGATWLAWRPDGTAAGLPSPESGLSSFYATVTRRILGDPPNRYGRKGAVWIRGRGKVSLRREDSVLGSGANDWGISLLAQRVYGRALVLAEAGYLDLGEPEGVHYNSLATGSLTMSYRPSWFGGYLLAGVVASSASHDGDPAYTEISLGGGLPLSRSFLVSLLASRGITDTSPDEGLALQMAWHPSYRWKPRGG